MSCPPDVKQYAYREQLRHHAKSAPNVLVVSADLIKLLDYIDEQDAALYAAWEDSMGDDL